MPPLLLKRTYLDPIHQDIVLDRAKPEERLIIDLIDTREFQRMRRIHQLGVSFFTFHGAEGSRFTHSLGVMNVASQLADILAQKTPSVVGYRALIMASALLHDLGHGPYSHVTEKILGYHHEDWSCKIIAGNTEVAEILRACNKSEGLPAPEQIVQMLKKTFLPGYVSHIISSQLDVDRFDYLLRDSYNTGTAYGLFALKRILRSMEVDEAMDRIVVVGEKGQIAVEDYLFARYSMYAQVYYHRKNLAARALLSTLLKRAKHVLKENPAHCFADECTYKWLVGDELTVEEYLELDDVQFTYHIKRWVKSPDKILADLAARFLNRGIFKAMRIPYSIQPCSHPSMSSISPEEFAEQISTIEKRARKIVADAGLDPDYYVKVESTGFRPYDYYRPDADIPQTNIVIRTDCGAVMELSQLSLAVDALVKGNYESHWLVFPAEVTEKIEALRELTPAKA